MAADADAIGVILARDSNERLTLLLATSDLLQAFVRKVPDGLLVEAKLLLVHDLLLVKPPVLAATRIYGSRPDATIVPGDG
jgi:hypothetical protein